MVKSSFIEKAMETVRTDKLKTQRLYLCKRHNFVRVGVQFKCENCKGEVNSGNAAWYRMGLEHGKQ